jgi:ATP-dependent 26S proteasome regulatory subunit
VPPPDNESREQILRINLINVPAAPDVNRTEGVQALVKATAGFSGAEVVSIVQEAAMVCIEKEADEMNLSDLLGAAGDVKPQITPAMINFYSSLQERYK